MSGLTSQLVVKIRVRLVDSIFRSMELDEYDTVAPRLTFAYVSKVNISSTKILVDYIIILYIRVFLCIKRRHTT